MLLIFGPQYFKENDEWESILSVLAATNHPALFTEDDRLPVGAGAFNWPPMWLSLAPGTRGVLSMAALRLYHLRRAAAAAPSMQPELDGVFADLVAGNMDAARDRLASVEAALEVAPANEGVRRTNE